MRGGLKGITQGGEEGVVSANDRVPGGGFGQVPESESHVLRCSHAAEQFWFRTCGAGREEGVGRWRMEDGGWGNGNREWTTGIGD